MSNRTRAYIQKEIDEQMTYKQARKYFQDRIILGQCGKSTSQRKAFIAAIKALDIVIKQEEETDCQWK